MTQTITIQSEDELPRVVEDVEEQFYRLDYTSMLIDELDRIADLHRTYFATQSGPDGAGWKANKPATIRKKKHHLILRGERKNRFRLSQSLTLQGRHSAGDAIREVFATGNGSYMVFGTEVPYSGFNEDRPHVGLTMRFVDQMVEDVADFAVRELAR